MSLAKVAATLIAPCLAAAVLLSMNGCGQPAAQSSKPTSQTTASHASQPVVRHSATNCAPATGFGGANAANVPAMFPADFPTYPGASFAAGTHPTLSRVTVTWTTTASGDAIRAYFEKKLQAGDWQLFGEQYTDPCGAYWHVERRSDVHYGGLVSLHAQPGDAGSAFITADLDKK